MFPQTSELFAALVNFLSLGVHSASLSGRMHSPLSSPPTSESLKPLTTTSSHMHTQNTES